MAQTILLVQEDRAGAQAVCEALIHSSDGPFQVEWVKSCGEGLRRLDRQRQHGADAIAAVLLDLFLPDSCGLDTFERLFHAAPQIPMLVLSAPQHEDLAKLAVQRGAQDYLLRTASMITCCRRLCAAWWSAQRMPRHYSKKRSAPR